ncbi:MAG: ArsI/CadI family heavy metal resistance metalloenzyme [Acidimicrobiales bacterium]
MSRVQLALNVSDLDEAVQFYSKLFATEPAKLRPGYANFAVVDPPLKLVLIEDDTKAPGSLNHLGVEVATTEEVTAAQTRLSAEKLPTATEEQVNCCFALQDKVWVDGPGGEPWEIYTVLADAEMPAGELRSADPSGAVCCATRPDLASTRSGTSCC